MAGSPLVITATGGLKELPLVTTIGAVGSDAAIPTEQAVREAVMDKADTGFESRTTSTLAFDAGTRNVTVGVVSGSFPVWTGGVKHTKTGGASCLTQIPNTVGQHYVYFDTDGVLKNAASPWNIEGNVAPVATVYWNGSAGMIGDERHSCYRNKAWHHWAHDTIGCRYGYGLTGTFTSSSLSVTQGSIYDEDLESETPVSPLTVCRLLYRASGAASMTWDAGATITAKVTAGALQYDNGGTLAAVDSAKYAANWVYATNDPTYPLAVVIGQAQYSTLAAARSATTPTLAGMTTTEWKLLYRVIWQNSGGTPTYVESADYRTVTSLPGGVVTNVTASSVTVTPTGNIAVTNAQAALEELDAEKAALVHASRHQHGGADELATATPTANAIPKADASGKLDGWITGAVVTADVTYYVATTGSDTTGTGASGTPWATPAYALSVLGNLRVQEGKIVTILCGDGVYSASTPITNLPKGFLLTGTNTYAKTMSSVQSSSGSAGAYSIVINLNDVANITTSDTAIISASSGGTNPIHIQGCWAITNVDTGNKRMTVTSTHRGAPPAGSVAATVTIIKTHLSFSGCTGVSFFNLNGGKLDKLVVLGNNTASTNGISLDQSTCECGYLVGVSGFGSDGVLLQNGAACVARSIAVSNNGRDGVRVQIASSVSMTSAICSGNAANGVNSRLAGTAMALSAVFSGNATNDVFAERWGYVYAVSSTISGTASPAANTLGNDNGYIDT